MKKKNLSILSWSCIVSLTATAATLAATAPTFTITPPVMITSDETDFIGLSCNLAANTDKPQILLTIVDTSPSDSPLDPLTGEPAQQVLRGYFIDPMTLAPVGESFVIAGNPDGGVQRSDVKYNPVTRQFVVATTLLAYRPNGLQSIHLALVGTDPVAGTNPVARRWIHAPGSEIPFQEPVLAVSPNNGNIALVAELSSPADEGEAVIGALMNGQGELLTEPVQRIDRVTDPTRDEDDPDIIYLPKKDVFLFITNTDVAPETPNRIVGAVIETAPNPTGTLVVSPVQFLGTNRLEGLSEGHPASVENPWNGEILTAFDYGNDQPNGDVSYYSLGGAPTYSFTQARPQAPYLAGTGRTPFGHRHPQVAVDPVAGVFLIGVNIGGSEVGIPDGVGFKLLDPEGAFLPGVSEETQIHVLAETGAPIAGDPNSWNVKYDSFSGGFIFAWYAGSVGMSIARLNVTSNHLPVTSPSLTITRTPTGVEIRWPSSASGFELQSRAAVDSGTWERVNATVDTQGGFQVVSLAASAAASYFRLVARVL